jgi:L-asparaginase II
VLRAGRPESWHFGVAAVVTPEGTRVGQIGDPGAAETATYLRSAAKPFQALPLLLAGGAERFSLDAADLALICASHGGTPEHTRRALSLLERGGFGVADLLCGTHPPFDRPAAQALERRGEAPSPLHSNCSGKHAGMLLACRLLDLPTASYVEPDHPLQERILTQLAAILGCDRREIGIGVDGCSVPSFHLPVEAAARGYAALADPEAAGLPPAVTVAVNRVVAAMTGAPEMVAGPGRFTTRLMEVTGGRVLGKEGAEGFYAAAVRGPVALGMAVKIADGGERCRDGVVLDLLRQMGALSGEEFAALEEYYRPVLRSCRGVAVGEVTPEVELLACVD